MLKRFRDWINSLYLWLNSHWLASAFFYIVPSALITLVEFLGNRLGLTNQSGDLNLAGQIIIVASVLFIAFYGFVKEYADSTFRQANKEGQEILKRVLRAVGEAKNRKKDRFIEYIDKYRNQPNVNPFPHITQPEKQLEEVLTELKNTFVDLFGVKESQLGISLVCQLEGDTEWLVPARVNVSSPEHIKKVLVNPNSTFSAIVHGRTKSVFIASKAKALLSGHYISSERDYGQQNVGSIVCLAVDIAGESDYVKGILSISTYGSELFEEGDDLAQKKIKEEILPAFIKRIYLELTLLYIKTKMFQ